MPPKRAKATTMSLNDFAADQYASKALPTASEGLEQEKGKKGSRKGEGRYDDRAAGRDGDSADTGVWRGGAGGDFGRGKGGDRGAGGFRDGDGGFRDRGGRGGGGGRRDDDEPSRADTGDWHRKEALPERGSGFRDGDRDRGFGAGRDRTGSTNLNCNIKS